MGYALVSKEDSTVYQVVEAKADCFEVHESLEWVKCGKEVEHGWLHDAGKFYSGKAELDYAQLRALEYPPLGDAADIAYKQRQKAKMLVGKARKMFEEGRKDEAFLVLMEAVEPVEDALDYDSQVAHAKANHQKTERGEK